jgi:hypothetical protein
VRLEGIFLYAGLLVFAVGGYALAQQAPAPAPKTALEMQIAERKGQIDIYDAAAKEAAARSEAAKALAASSRAELAKLEAQLPKAGPAPVTPGRAGSEAVHPAQPGPVVNAPPLPANRMYLPGSRK